MQSIYGAYGIRGIWGIDIDESIGKKLAQAYVTRWKPKQVAVGRDGRKSGSAMSRAVIDGLRESGVDVVDLGIVPVDAFYFAVSHFGYDGGAMVTASHNPSEWNGVKFVDRNAQLLTGGRNRDLGKIMEGSTFERVSGREGRYETRDIVPEFADFVASVAELRQSRPLKVVVDPGNGAVVRVIPDVFKRTSFGWSGINMEIDGMFPGRGPDPKKKGALIGLGRAVVERGADVGVAFDADGDRMFLVDERGRALTGEATGIILARFFLARSPGASIVYNVVCSRIVPEQVTAAGGKPVRAGVGSINMKPAIERTGAAMGIETAGHYIIREHNYLDSSIVPMALALRAIAAERQPLSVIASPLEPYAHEFVDLRIDDVDGALAKIRRAYAKQQLDELDGITVEYPDWWFNVRPSNTEPLLRLSVEAKTKAEMERRRDEILRIIRG